MSSYRGRGDISLERKAYRAALADYREALGLAKPDEKADLQLNSLACAQVLRGRHEQATAIVEAVVKQAKAKGADWQAAAEVYALAAAAVGNDTKRSESQRARLREQYALRAISLLHQGRAAGFFATKEAVKKVRNSKDLQKLWDRKDFQDWLRELERQVKP
jgi:hypothetical protein